MSILGDRFFSPTDIDPRDSLESGVFLTALLVLLVPIGATVLPVPTLVLVSAAGGIYALYLFGFDKISPGLGSAFFVLITFNANVPLVALTEQIHLSLYIADLALVPLLAVLLFEHPAAISKLTRTNRAILALATIFVGWTVLAAFFGAGPSTVAGLLFSVEQLRYLLILITTILYVKYNGYRCAIYPLMVAIIGHSVFAFAQAYHGSIFGLSTLGEATPKLIDPINIGPIVYQSGLHTGGFMGSSRVLGGALLLFVPLFLVFMCELRFSSLFTGIGLSVFGVLVLMSNSDSAWGAFLLELGIFAAVLYIVENVGGRIGVPNASGLALAVVMFNFILREWRRIINGLFSLTSSNYSGDVTSPTETPANGVNPPGGGSALFDTSTLGTRLIQYYSAIEIGFSYPLFGLGGYNFSLISTNKGLPPMMGIHNIFLAYLAAAGGPGLIVFLTTIGLIVSVIAKYSLSESGLKRRVAIALFSGLTGFLAMAFWTTLNNSTPAMSVMWAVCGIGLGLVDSTSQ